jgi:hypothetical protein
MKRERAQTEGDGFAGASPSVKNMVDGGNVDV